MVGSDSVPLQLSCPLKPFRLVLTPSQTTRKAEAGPSQAVGETGATRDRVKLEVGVRVEGEGGSEGGGSWPAPAGGGGGGVPAVAGGQQGGLADAARGGAQVRKR